MRFDDAESRYSRHARRSKPQQTRLIIYAVLLAAVIAAMFALKRTSSTIEWQPSLDKAMARALAENKPILAFFYTDGSEECQRMARDTFGDAAVRAQVTRFVCVRLDGEAHPETAERCLYGTLDYPAVAFLSPAGEPLLVSWDERSPRQMLKEIDAALERWDAHQRGQLTGSPPLPPKDAGLSRGEDEPSSPDGAENEADPGPGDN